MDHGLGLGLYRMLLESQFRLLFFFFIILFIFFKFSSGQTPSRVLFRVQHSSCVSHPFRRSHKSGVHRESVPRAAFASRRRIRPAYRMSPASAARVASVPRSPFPRVDSVPRTASVPPLCIRPACRVCPTSVPRPAQTCLACRVCLALSQCAACERNFFFFALFDFHLISYSFLLNLK